MVMAENSPAWLRRFHQETLNPDWAMLGLLSKKYPDLPLSRHISTLREGERNDLHMGAMVLIHFGDEVFLTKDEPKREMTWGMSMPVEVEGEVFSLPAGARNGMEDIGSTIGREFEEEVGVELPEDVDLKLVSGEPFVVSQREREEGKVIQFGVWVVAVDVGETPGLKRELDEVVMKGGGKWVNIKDVLEGLSFDEGGMDMDLLEEVSL